MNDFLKPAIKGFVDVLYPLRQGLSSAEDFELMLAKYGWDAKINDSEMEAVKAAFAVEPVVVSTLEKLDVFINGVNIDKATATLELILEVKNAVDKLGNLTSTTTGLPFPLDQSSFWSEISADLFSDLLADNLEKYQPVIYAIFHISNIISYDFTTPSGSGRIPYTRTKLDFGKLGEFFNSPHDLFKDTYKWDVSGEDFDHKKLIKTIERILLAFQLPVTVNLPRDHVANEILDVDQIGPQEIRELEIPILEGVSPTDDAYWNIGMIMLPVPDPLKGSGKVKGLTIQPLLHGNLSNNIYFTNDIYLKLTGAFDSAQTIYLHLYPNKTGLDTSLTDVEIKAAFELIGNPNTPWILLGSPKSSRVELGGFKLSLTLKGTVSNPETILSIGTGDNATNKNPRFSFVLNPSGADGFLNQVLGDNEFNIDFQSNLIWSSKSGLAFEGQTGFEIELPIHQSLGPIEITTLYIAMKGGNSGSKPNARADLGIGLKGELGPLTFVVENIGTSLSLKPIDDPSEKGLLGNHDLEFGFKPPNGLGISINAGAVIGGGYLFFDHEKEEYAGVLELTIAEFISAKAIGLITTKMPDGSKGFSMIVIITAEFNPPFQLGYGFTLNGVGGLLGLNRTVLLDPLRDGVRTGAVNNIMFPKNVIANATRIISDLKTIFPPNDDKFLIGPMGKVGWGTPSLITLSVGLIIEIPGNLAILGVLKISLPEERIPLVKIQVAFVGTLDFDKKMLTFDASLYESFILHMTLEGDMAVRLKWGDQPDFILTVGGFHPSFNPPPLALPTLRRLSISILNTSIAKIRVECYQAVTSNTVQFGAKAEIYFDLKACSISGHIAFDALFQFSPFYFIIQLSSSFNLKAAGISVMSVRVKMTLEGTTPWKAKGTGKVSLFFFSISANFTKNWGDKKDTSLPSIKILPKLKEELKKAPQWSADLVSDKNLLVTLRKLEESASPELILHPSGSLMVQQKLMPLSVNIDKVGNQKTSDIKKAVISGAFTEDLYTNTQTDLKITEVKESFARAQYQELKDAEKLSKPSFEKMPGGVRISMGNNIMKNGQMVRKKIEYEVTIVDKEPVKPFQFGKFFTEIESLFSNFLKGGSVAKSQLSLRRQKRFQPFDEKLDVLEEGYTVAFQSDNKAFDESATFSSEMMAHSYMQDQIMKNPTLKGEVHIIPNFELQAA